MAQAHPGADLLFPYDLWDSDSELDAVCMLRHMVYTG